MENLKKHIAIVGASGNVGRKLLEVIQRRNFLPEQLSLLASNKSAGKKIHFNGDEIEIEALENFDFASVSLAFFAAGSEVAEKYVPLAARAGAKVIDNSSHFRMSDGVPLCVPEINGDVLKNMKGNIIANPNCSTIQFVLALAPIHRAKKIERVFVSTYQSVSGAGVRSVNQLKLDIENKVRNSESLAFNVVPKIDKWLSGGENKEEWKIRVETAKILDPEIIVSSHCVRVPVLVGHSEAVFLRCKEKITPEEAKEILQGSAGIIVSKKEYETPLDCEGKDEIFISRVRQDPNDENALHLWVTADNLLKGAALNAVQIAETLLKN